MELFLTTTFSFSHRPLKPPQQRQATNQNKKYYTENQFDKSILEEQYFTKDKS